MEVLGEPPDRTDVGKCGSLRVITALEFLEHPFAKLGHRDLLVTQTYLLAASDASPCHHAQRPPRERLSSDGVIGKVRTTWSRSRCQNPLCAGTRSSRIIGSPASDGFPNWSGREGVKSQYRHLHRLSISRP